MACFSKHSIFRHDNFIGCFSADKIKMSARKYFCFNIPIETLSKILCKWKQDSVVSLFLYLNSVFKHKHKLIHNQAPV